MARVLGLDCGGSATKVRVAEGSATLWGGKLQACNLATSGRDGLRTVLSEVREHAENVGAICAAFAGLLTEEQRQVVIEEFGRMFPGAKCVAVPDYEAALAACGNAADICVIAGTGSIVCSTKGGGTVVSGGRGYLLGDEGSAFQYGRDALLHFLDAPASEVSADLRAAIEEQFGTEDKRRVIANLYESSNRVQQLAALSRAFALDAERNAIYALKSLRIHPGKLAHVVAVHLRTHHPELRTVRVGCQGGLWQSDVFRAAFQTQLEFWCKADKVEAVFNLPEPVYGAVKLAQGLLDGN